MPDITPEQKEKYLKYRGVRCLHCGDKDIESGNYDAEADFIRVSVYCNNCNQRWVDIYTLTDVEEDG